MKNLALSLFVLVLGFVSGEPARSEPATAKYDVVNSYDGVGGYSLSRTQADKVIRDYLLKPENGILVLQDKVYEMGPGRQGRIERNCAIIGPGESR